MPKKRKQKQTSQKVFKGEYFVTDTSKTSADKEVLLAQQDTEKVALTMPKRSSFKAIEKAKNLAVFEPGYGNTRITPRRPKLR